VSEFLDIVQFWMLSEFEIEEKARVKLRRSLLGPLTTEEGTDTSIPHWAPSWWQGDEDATASNMAAMKSLTRR
jgi:hypothetical protein